MSWPCLRLHCMLAGLLLCGCSKAPETQLLPIPETISAATLAGTPATFGRALHGEYLSEIGCCPGPGMVLTMTADGQLFLEKASITARELALQLTVFRKRLGTWTPVFLWVDRQAKLASLVPIFAAMRSAHLWNLNLGGMDAKHQAVFRYALVPDAGNRARCGLDFDIAIMDIKNAYPSKPDPGAPAAAIPTVIDFPSDARIEALYQQANTTQTMLLAKIVPH